MNYKITILLTSIITLVSSITINATGGKQTEKTSPKGFTATTADDTP